MEKLKNSNVPPPHIQTVLRPVLYTDIFDYPLTINEIFLYLEVDTSIDNLTLWLAEAVSQGYLIREGEYFSLPGRNHLVGCRVARRKIAEQLWPRALQYGLIIASIPFVKMVAVTGALAVDNPRDQNDDIDYFIVTEPGRLWFCRAVIIALVRLGHRQGTHLCPNYLITENALDLENTLYAARELLQMKPIYGARLYDQIRQKNQWITSFFPQGKNFIPGPSKNDLPWLRNVAKVTSEHLLTGWLGDRLELCLRKTQMEKHSRRATALGSPESVVFSADVCKGHYDGHGLRTLELYHRKLNRLHLNGKNGTHSALRNDWGRE
jgi:hypothetical protein